MPAPLLRIAHLTKRFGNATVVDDLSLEIMPGECLGVIGPAGRSVHPPVPDTAGGS